MAHSVVKVTDIKDDELNDSLLLLVGEDGTVTPDQDTVETFLKQRNGPTNIQIMKINKMEKQGIDITVDNVTYMPNTGDEEVVETAYNMDEVARNLYNFRLDHDYTHLTSPRRPSSSHEEDELVKTLSILDGPDESPLSVVTSEPPPLILTNKTKPKVKIIQSITLTPATTPQLSTVVGNKSVPSKPSTAQSSNSIAVLNSSEFRPAVTGSPTVATSTQRVSAVTNSSVNTPKVTTPVTPKPKARFIKTEPKIIPQLERAKPVKPRPKIVKEFVEEESDEDYEEADFDFEVDDDENDSDFDLEQELKVKQKPKRIGRRRKSESKSPRSSKSPVKSRSKENKPSEEIKVELQKTEVKEKEKEKEKLPEKPIEKPQPDQKSEQPETKPAEKKPPKKEKKVPKPILDDFALFSTPDIIRRVGGKEPTTPILEANSPTKPGKITSDSHLKSTGESPQSPSKHNRNSLDSKINTAEKDKHSNHSDNKSRERRFSTTEIKSKRTSIDEKVQEKMIKTDNKSEKHAFDVKKSEKEKSTFRISETSLGESISEQIPSAEDIRSIIMNEDTKSYTTNTLPLDLNNSLPETIDPNNLNLDASGLDLDPTLLDNLNNDEISEDILYQVAQSLVSNPELQNAIDKGINEGVLDPMAMDQNVMSNQVPTVQEPNDIIPKGTQIVRPSGRIVVIPPIERPTTRSRNKRKEETKAPFKPVHKPLDDEHVSGNELDSSNGEEDESEDDPNKLWCICNQPHNNRFMICCDTCEEWYHGKCVNITKAMGQQMEAEGKEWICLFCKDPSLKRPQAAARRIRKASRNSRTSTDSAGSTAKKADSSATSVPCVVCQKTSRKSSIYCSEACILAHAQGIERAVVFERSTGNMLTGNKAPSTANLEQWLREHPGYEVVRSGGKVVTSKAGHLTQSKLKLVKNTDDEGVSLALQKKGVNVGVLKHLPKQALPQTKPPLKATITGVKIVNKQVNAKEPKAKLIQAPPFPKPAPKESTPSKAKVSQSTPNNSAQTTPPPKPKTSLSKEKSTPAKTPKVRQPEQTVFPSPKPQENIRENVQKTIFEQLTNRLKGCEELKLSGEEVKNISAEIESQLYKCFGDTGQKYRNKYRSLIFNIKDVKNQTLWRRICQKSINPYELVRLSPDDLASQELALWREREAKHQLDMIKKSELELLNCNRQYVLKTHKGEQVVEDDRTDKVDNTEVIKSLTEGSTLDTVETKGDGSKESDKKGSSKHSHKDKDRDKSRDKDKKSNKDKDHRSHRSSSKDRDRDRSRKRSRSRDRSSRRSDHKKRSRSRNRDRDRHKKSSHKSSRQKKDKDITSTTDKLDKKSKEILEQLVDNKIVPPLEDRLWKHVAQEDVMPVKNTNVIAAESDSDHEPSSTVTIPTPPRSQESDEFSSSQTSTDTKNNLSISEKDKDSNLAEERSTSPPPRNRSAEIWRGTINMIDVAQISITAHEVSGDCSGLGKELPGKPRHCWSNIS
ncbi:hypothetical protein NQ317_014658 [Molorchus minor]|uniref:Death-inducer obliterator 1 n=1 Tax=Molorchus minor TaxID=1323400 RepID=A0ABQ9JAS6_9CUCU|nr:hypothetical protein NQ317_014658 [Molorchus minor]